MAHAISIPVPRKSSHPKRKVGESLKVGAVAQLLGVSASLVRSWERLGLARPARTRSRYRLYTNDDLRVLRRAIYLRRVQGLNATAIVSQLKQEGVLKQRASTPAQTAQSEIGPTFRKLHLQRGESLATVAGAVGVSIGFLSNLERSQSGASIGIMHRLAKHYGLNIVDLFNPIETTGPLVRRKIARLWMAVQACAWKLSPPERSPWNHICSTWHLGRKRRILLARRRGVSLSSTWPPDHHTGWRRVSSP